MRVEYVSTISFEEFRIPNLKSKVQICTSKLPAEVTVEKLVQVVSIGSGLELEDVNFNDQTKTVRFYLNSPDDFETLTDIPTKVANQKVTFNMLKENSSVFLFDHKNNGSGNGESLVFSEFDVYLASDFDDLVVISDELEVLEVPGIAYKFPVKQAVCSKFNKGLSVIYKTSSGGATSSMIRNTLSCQLNDNQFQIIPIDNTSGFIAFKNKATKTSLIKSPTPFELKDDVVVPPTTATTPTTTTTTTNNKPANLTSASNPTSTSTSTSTPTPTPISTPTQTPIPTSTPTPNPNTTKVLKKKSMKNVVTGKVTKKNSASELYQILENYGIKFITIRSKVAYIEMKSKEAADKICADDKLVTKDGWKLQFKAFTGYVPYIRAFLFPYTEGMNLKDVTESVQKLVSSPIGKVRFEKSHLIVPVSSEEDKKQLLEMRSIDINCYQFVRPNKNENKKQFGPKTTKQVWVFDGEDQSRRINSRQIDVSEQAAKLLQGKMKDILLQIRKEFNVLITIEQSGATNSVKLSSPMNNINDACNSMKAKLDADIKEVNYFFKCDTEVKKTMLLEMLLSLLKELSKNSKFRFNVLERKGQDSWIIDVNISASGTDVEEISKMLREIEVEDIELPPKELQLDAESVKSEFSVSFKVNEKSMTVCGTKSSLTNLKEWIKSNIKRESRVEMEMTTPEQFFFQKLIKADFHDVIVTETKHGLIINGEDKKVKEAENHVLSLKKSIENIKFTKSFPTNLVSELAGFLREYYKNDIVYTFFIKPSSLRKNKENPKAKKGSPSGSESSSDEDSEDEYSDDEESFTEKYASVRIDIYVHRQRDYDKVKAKTDALQKMPEGRVHEMRSVSFDEQRFILKYFADKYSNRLKVLKRQKIVAVQGLWEQDVKKLVAEIQVKRESFFSIERQTIEEEFRFNYLTVNPQRLIKIQDEFDVKIKFDKKDCSIIYKGKLSEIKKAKSHIKEIVKDLKMERHSIQSYYLPVQSLTNLRKELYEKFDVEMAYTEARDHIIVIGLGKSTPWDDIKKIVDELKPVDSIWPSVDKDPVKGHMELPDTFLQENGIIKKEFLKEEKRFKIYARNSSDLDDAIEALDNLAKDTLGHTKKIEIRSLYQWSLATKFNAEGFKKIQTNHPKVKIVLKERDRSIHFSGANEFVDPAYEETYAWFTVIARKITKVKVLVVNPVATEILKPTFYNYFMDKYKMLIQQDEDSNDNLISKKISNTVIEINSGDILLEKSDCIVNAANDRLQHYGGIAAHIADAAGSSFKKMCDEWVRKNGPVPTGSAMATKPGKLDFKIILHAVAPIWKPSDEAKCKQLLEKAIQNSLKLAVENQCLSIAIPAIGAGVYGVPKSIAAKCIINTVLEFVKNHPGKLQKIIICDRDEEVLKKFSEYFKKMTSTISERLLNYFSKATNPPTKGSETTTSTASTQSKYTTATFDPIYQWKWQENDGRFYDFDPDQNYQIEIAYLKKEKRLEIQGDINMQKNGHSYEIDLVNMTEMNTHYKTNRRPIQRVNMVNAKPAIWYYIDAKNNKVDINSVTTCGQISLAYQKRMKIRIDSPSATINFPDPTITLFNSFDINIGTYSLRQKSYDEAFKEYLDATKPMVSSMELNNKDLDNEADSEMEPTQVVMISCPNEDDSKQCQVILTKEIEEKFYERRIVQVSSEQFQRLNKELTKIAKTHHCSIKEGKDNIELHGPIQYTLHAENKMMRLLFTIASENGVIEYPWGKPGKKNLEMINLLNTSTQWNQVEMLVKQTLPQAHIAKIEKIQNNLLWEKYYTRRDQIIKKLNPNMKKSEIQSYELSLFHGTRSNDPKLIFNDEDGFDMRFSAPGMWGLATYFAKNASYSHVYSFPNGGYRQMLLAKVFIGDSTHIMPNNPKLQKPPKKPTSKEYPEYFDTISGETQGSYVYMLYENNRAYPEYLITYAIYP